MKCQFCENTATVHLKSFVKKNNQRDLRLCESCARKHNLIPDQPTPHIDVKALLNLLASQIGSSLASASAGALTCPACGLQYGEFRLGGRLGCPEDYDAFRDILEPLIERIHRKLGHAGKVPRGVREEQRKAALSLLRKMLTEAVAREDYEKASSIRDQIRQKDNSDEPR